MRDSGPGRRGQAGCGRSLCWRWRSDSSPAGARAQEGRRGLRGGRSRSAETPLAAYPGRPGASDLLLAYGIRRGQPGDTVTAPGEVRKGDLFIAASADLRMSPTHATMAYYCEVYRDSAATLPWNVQVVTADGRALITTPAAQTPVAAGGGVLMGSLDLTGLPPGMYRLGVVAGAGGGTGTRAPPLRERGISAEQH